MSFFLYSLTAPHDTSQANAITQTLTLHHGIIHNVTVYIPEGHAGLFHLQVFDSLHQLYPFVNGEDFHGDNIRFDFNDWYDLTKEPYTLIAKYWNDDDTFTHEVILCICVLPKWVLIPQLITKGVSSAWAKLIGKEIEV